MVKGHGQARHVQEDREQPPPVLHELRQLRCWSQHPAIGMTDVPAGTIPGFAFKPTLHVHYGEKVLSRCATACRSSRTSRRTSAARATRSPSSEALHRRGRVGRTHLAGHAVHRTSDRDRHDGVRVLRFVLARCGDPLHHAVDGERTARGVSGSSSSPTSRRWRSPIAVAAIMGRDAPIPDRVRRRLRRDALGRSPRAWRFANASLYDPYWSVAPPVIRLYWASAPAVPARQVAGARARARSGRAAHRELGARLARSAPPGLALRHAARDRERAVLAGEPDRHPLLPTLIVLRRMSAAVRRARRRATGRSASVDGLAFGGDRRCDRPQKASPTNSSARSSRSKQPGEICTRGRGAGRATRTTSARSASGGASGCSRVAAAPDVVLERDRSRSRSR